MLIKIECIIRSFALFTAQLSLYLQHCLHLHIPDTGGIGMVKLSVAVIAGNEFITTSHS